MRKNLFIYICTPCNYSRLMDIKIPNEQGDMVLNMGNKLLSLLLNCAEEEEPAVVQE